MLEYALACPCVDVQGPRGLRTHPTSLVDAIEAARSAHAFDLWAYVFVPEYVHLVLQ